MMRRRPLFLFCLFYTAFLHSQNIWYFGNGAGLNFTFGNPEPTFDGKLYTLEGCATACDERGKLLFYTDGLTIWNSAHAVMENGQGLNGSHSSTQVLIVPQPESKGRYFVFVTDEKAGKKGLTYSVVDMSLGAGVVVKKNVLIMATCSEKLTAVKKDDGTGFWVLAHQWNSSYFYSFPITASGIGAPVYSSVGLPHAETGAGDNKEAIGCMAASPDGKKIAVAVCYRSKNNIELFDFDVITGKLSSGRTITINGSPYGLCFSSDNKQLYVSCLKGKSGVLQYNLASGSLQEIIESKKDNSFGSLKMGPDNRIYISRSDDFMDVISFPDRPGKSCGYIHDIVDLSPATGNFGLPNVFYSLLTKATPSAPSSSSAVQAILPGSQQLSGNEQKQPEYSGYVSVSDSLDCLRFIERPFTAPGQLVMTRISVCESEYILSAKNFGASFNWSTLATTQKIAVKSSGLYKVAVSKQGCTVVDSLFVHFRKDDAVFTYLPSFNPESEFLNSEFHYEINDVRFFELKVFSASRNVLFETNNVNVKWRGRNLKGKSVPAGEYTWKVRYIPNCPKDSEITEKEGKVVLKRSKK